MDFERAMETQRRRLLRVIAGLVAVVGFLSAVPVSRGFSVWTCAFVGSILSRAEAAARYLVIARAHAIVARSGMGIDRRRISEALSLTFAADETDISLSACQRRLKTLRTVLLDLPRHALRLLRRIEKQMRRTGCVPQPLPHPDQSRPASLCDWRLAESRIDRPPDKNVPATAVH